MNSNGREFCARHVAKTRGEISLAINKFRVETEDRNERYETNTGIETEKVVCETDAYESHALYPTEITMMPKLILQELDFVRQKWDGYMMDSEKFCGVLNSISPVPFTEHAAAALQGTNNAMMHLNYSLLTIYY